MVKYVIEKLVKNGKEQRADARAVLVNGPVREKKAGMTEARGEGGGSWGLGP